MAGVPACVCSGSSTCTAVKLHIIRPDRRAATVAAATAAAVAPHRKVDLYNVFGVREHARTPEPIAYQRIARTDGRERCTAMHASAVRRQHTHTHICTRCTNLVCERRVHMGPAARARVFK